MILENNIRDSAVCNPGVLGYVNDDGTRSDNGTVLTRKNIQQCNPVSLKL